MPVKTNACGLPLTIHRFQWGGCIDTTSHPKLLEQNLSFSELIMKTARRAYYLQYNNFLIQLHLHFIKGSSYLCGFQFGIISSEFDMFDNCVSGMDPDFRKFHSFSSIHIFIYPSWKKIWKCITIIKRFDIAKECCNFTYWKWWCPAPKAMPRSKPFLYSRRSWDWWK